MFGDKSLNIFLLNIFFSNGKDLACLFQLIMLVASQAPKLLRSLIAVFGKNYKIQYVA